MPVYQGLLDHKNAGQQFAKANSGQDKGANDAGAAPGQNGAKAPVRPAESAVKQAGEVRLTFGTKAHPEFKGQALAEVVKSADGRDLVRYLAGPQWAADTDEKRAIKRACDALVPTLPAEAPAQPAPATPAPVGQPA